MRAELQADLKAFRRRIPRPIVSSLSPSSCPIKACRTGVPHRSTAPRPTLLSPDKPALSLFMDVARLRSTGLALGLPLQLGLSAWKLGTSLRIGAGPVPSPARQAPVTTYTRNARKGQSGIKTRFHTINTSHPFRLPVGKGRLRHVRCRVMKLTNANIMTLRYRTYTFSEVCIDRRSRVDKAIDTYPKSGVPIATFLLRNEPVPE